MEIILSNNILKL